MADFNVPQKPEDLLEGGGNFYSAEDIALSEALAQFDGGTLTPPLLASQRHCQTGNCRRPAGRLFSWRVTLL
jgi:hypothetical protein